MNSHGHGNCTKNSKQERDPGSESCRDDKNSESCRDDKNSESCRDDKNKKN